MALVTEGREHLARPPRWKRIVAITLKKLKEKVQSYQIFHNSKAFRYVFFF